jgi:amidase
VPTAGTWALAPSLDTIGPLARDVAGVIEGMRLLEPRFAPSEVTAADVRVHRLRLPAHPDVDRAVDAALSAAGLRVSDLHLADWNNAWGAADVILSAEAWRQNRDLLAADPSGISPAVSARLRAGSPIDAAQESVARSFGRQWRAALESLLNATSVIAVPTLADFPPLLDARSFEGTRFTLPVNLAGLPALSMPVPTRGPLPASLQLIGPQNGEDLLVTIGRVIEAAL